MKKISIYDLMRMTNDDWQPKPKVKKFTRKQLKINVINNMYQDFNSMKGVSK
jgi:adenine C2-methylase RlmN of 23S rRNA A2503 and tRNA A37